MGGVRRLRRGRLRRAVEVVLIRLVVRGRIDPLRLHDVQVAADVRACVARALDFLRIQEHRCERDSREPAVVCPPPHRRVPGGERRARTGLPLISGSRGVLRDICRRRRRHLRRDGSGNRSATRRSATKSEEVLGLPSWSEARQALATPQLRRQMDEDRRRPGRRVARAARGTGDEARRQHSDERSDASSVHDRSREQVPRSGRRVRNLNGDVRCRRHSILSQRKSGPRAVPIARAGKSDRWAREDPRWIRRNTASISPCARAVVFRDNA